jgi:hypothetical protein
MKPRQFIFLFLVLTALSSCMKEDDVTPEPVIAEIEDSEWAQVKENAFKAFDDARAEFFAGIPSAFDAKKLKPKGIQDIADLPAPPTEDGDEVTYEIEYSDTVSYSEISEEEYDVQEKIQALAMESQLTGDATALQEYLQEVGLYDRFLEISSKYNLEQHAKNLIVKRKAIAISKFKNAAFRDGDIFVKSDISSSAISGGSAALGSSSISSGSSVATGASSILIGTLGYLILGKWGHAGFLDKERRDKKSNYFILSSSNETDTHEEYQLTFSDVVSLILNPLSSVKLAGHVGHDKVEGYWTNATEVAVTRPRGSTAAQGSAAITYAKQFFGKPWGIQTTRTDNSIFYCSKLVYRGWLSQGYELEPHKYDSSGLWWVPYPVFSHWAYKKVWFAKIWYPVFRTEYIKDTWVTPKNLYDSTDKIASF